MQKYIEKIYHNIYAAKNHFHDRRNLVLTIKKYISVYI